MSIGDFKKKKRAPSTEYSAWKDSPTDENYSNLMSSLDGVIKSGLQTYANGSPQLRTRANIITGKAIKSWDPKRETTLNTWVYQQLQGLRRIRAERSQVVHIPENVRLDRMQVKRFQDEYRDKHGYDPDDTTIGDTMQMSVKRVKKALQRGEVSEGSYMSDKGDLLGQDRSEARVWMDYVYHDLDPMNRKIFEWTTGYNGVKPIPKREIAQRLKISAPAISLRVNKIMSKLQEVT